MKKFRMRTKPKKPKKEILKHRIYIDDRDNLQEILNNIPLGVLYQNVHIEFDYSPDLYKDPSLVCLIEESNEKFEQRMKDYYKNLNKYNKWLKENKENIKQYKKEKEDTKSKREKEKLNRLKKEKEKIEKRIKELEN